jgi:hypothetical protein
MWRALVYKLEKLEPREKPIETGFLAFGFVEKQGVFTLVAASPENLMAK